MLRTQIRLLRDYREFRACEDIQRIVWGSVGVSGELLAITQKYGGVVLGALVGRKLVGFLYAFLARRCGRLIHWSHLMAVEPAFRDTGAGLGMKLAHRRIALRRGIGSISWTYDPLQSRNATLNVARLGARVEEYIPDCYGQFSSTIERGLPSDRFVLDWRIGSPRVAGRLRQEWAPIRSVAESLPRVNLTRLNARGLLENRRLSLDLRVPRLLIEIPTHTDRMRSEDLALARRWRFEMRRVFTRYLARGYSIEDFIPPDTANGGRCFYVIRRRRG